MFLAPSTQRTASSGVIGVDRDAVKQGDVGKEGTGRLECITLGGAACGMDWGGEGEAG